MNNLKIPENFKFRYSEPEILNLLLKHIMETYDAHYTFADKKQAIDLFHEIDHSVATTYCFSNALKYLFRYGKKEGKNMKDLLKAVHCIMMLIHFEFFMKNAGEDEDSN